MKRIAVIYQSKYGTTRRYAEWIAEALNAPLLEASGIGPGQLMDYDIIVFGGGLYASGILGVELVAKNPCKSLVVFTVGLATPEITDYSDILAKNFPAESLPDLKVFHLQGGIDYKKLGMVHKTMMALKKKEAAALPFSQRTSDQHGLLETYGAQVDFTDKEKIQPLVDYVRSM